MRMHVSALLVCKTAIEFLGWLTGCLLLAEDVNQGLIRYVMHEEKVQETTDSFQFLVKDSKPNVVSGNIFHIQWSLISFTYTRSVAWGLQHSADRWGLTWREAG